MVQGLKRRKKMSVQTGASRVETENAGKGREILIVRGWIGLPGLVRLCSSMARSWNLSSPLLPVVVSPSGNETSLFLSATTCRMSQSKGLTWFETHKADASILLALLLCFSFTNTPSTAAKVFKRYLKYRTRQNSFSLTATYQLIKAENIYLLSDWVIRNV